MNNNQTIQFHPLTFVPESEGICIGRFGTDEYAVFPEDGAALIQKLQEGMTIGEATSWYQETYQEELDMADFLETLRELTFIRDQMDDTEVTEVIGKRWGQIAFSPLAWLMYGVIFGGALWMMFLFPQLRPERNNIFFSEYSTLIIVGLFLGQMPGILFHESMHMLAGRKFGIPSKLSIGRRMYILVFQASMPGIWGLPRHMRYLPFLSGMLGDLLWFSILVITAGLFLLFTGHLPLFAAFCNALAFMTLLRFFWQFYFHLQTDIYYVMITLLGCINLQETTREYLKNSWYKLIGAHHKMFDESKWSERDRTVAKWYSIFYVVGWLFMVFILIYMIPVAIRFLTNVYVHLVYGEDANFWDSVIFLLINGIQYGIVLVLYLKERKNRKQRSHVTLTQEG